MSLPKLGTTRHAQLGLGVVKEIVMRPANEGGLGWLFRELPSMDFGIDGQIELVDDSEPPQVTGRLLSVQVKCGESYFAVDDGPTWSVYIPKATVEYWRNHSVPVLFVIVEPGRREAFWVRGDVGDFERKQESYRIRVLKHQRLARESRDELADLAEHTTQEARNLARLEADAPLIKAASQGKEVVMELTYWHNKSSGRMDFWIGVPGANPTKTGPSDMVPFTSGSGLATGGDPMHLARHVVPWADALFDEEFEEQSDDDLLDEYLAETGIWDSEDQVYIDVRGEFSDWLAARREDREGGPVPHYVDGEVTCYRLQLQPKQAALAYLIMRDYLKENAPAIEQWPPSSHHEV